MAMFLLQEVLSTVFEVWPWMPKATKLCNVFDWCSHGSLLTRLIFIENFVLQMQWMAWRLRWYWLRVGKSTDKHIHSRWLFVTYLLISLWNGICYIMVITARLRSLWQSNVFIRVCLFPEGLLCVNPEGLVEIYSLAPSPTSAMLLSNFICAPLLPHRAPNVPVLVSRLVHSPLNSSPTSPLVHNNHPALVLPDLI